MRAVIAYVVLSATVTTGCQSVIIPDLEVVATKRDGLANPTDLAFNPARPGELWVVNRDDDSTTIIFDALDADKRSIETLVDPYALHFMDRVSSISFDTNGLFGTCQDSTNTYNGSASGNNFMGPTLWTSDLDVYAQSNPEAVEYLSALFGMPVELGSHLDMLHESPQCMGIEWEQDNVYWVFDGWDGSIVRYDFGEDHGAGFDDHSDGVISRYASGKVKRVNKVVSHLALDHDSGLLYIADTGNGRIAVLDTAKGARGDTLFTTEPGTDHHEMRRVSLETLVDGFDRPAGLELIEGKLVMTENGSGLIYVLELDGTIAEVIDPGLGEKRLAGIHGETLSDLWFVDQGGDTVYRMQLKL